MFNIIIIYSQPSWSQINIETLWSSSKRESPAAFSPRWAPVCRLLKLCERVDEIIRGLQRSRETHTHSETARDNNRSFPQSLDPPQDWPHPPSITNLIRSSSALGPVCVWSSPLLLCLFVLSCTNEWAVCVTCAYIYGNRSKTECGVLLCSTAWALLHKLPYHFLKSSSGTVLHAFQEKGSCCQSDAFQKLLVRCYFSLC